MLKFISLIILFFITMHPTQSSAKGSSFIENPTTNTFVSNADGFFKCGGVIEDRVLTKAEPLNCVVDDNSACKSLFSESTCHKQYRLTYPAYAQYRADREKRKIKYLGMSVLYVGRDSDLRVLVFVSVIPQ